ncbi:MAG: hypothetical protein K9N23_18480 [Akkermansiaceae bacterium]|nr:hypothetical protein [Akkermansiaceae bacterium]MCF7733681.1 hypothetical protein [Akkermansiaceae bacterium]
MRTLRFTLLAEGTSDRVLIPILRWMLLRRHGDFEWIGQTADLHALPRPPRSLQNKIKTAIELFPADVLFIHRDADRDLPERRQEQVASAINSCPGAELQQWVPVIPVRMTEAWLLVSEQALRHAAGNPNGRVPLCLPALQDVESVPDPKSVLQDLLVRASELSGRRKKKFSFPEHRARIPDFFQDWEMLLGIPSVKAVHDNIASLNFS